MSLLNDKFAPILHSLSIFVPLLFCQPQVVFILKNSLVLFVSGVKDELADLEGELTVTRGLTIKLHSVLAISIQAPELN